MKDLTYPEAILAFILLLVACALLEKGAAVRSAAPAREATPRVTEPSATEFPVAIESPAATETPGIPVTGTALVQVHNVGSFGPALVDGQGHALYGYTGGEQYSRPRPCVGEECLEEWRPLLTTGQPVAGPGVNAALLGTIPNADGTTQVTYNGWRLYTLGQDTAPGDALGQADDNEWYLLSSSGEPIKTPGRE